MTVAAGLVEVAGRIAADRDPDGGVDVAGREAVTRRARPVDVDLHGRLTERGEHREIGDALDGRELRLDLVGRIGERLQIVAEQLDRILAFDAGHRLGDIVLQILREIELDAGEARLQLAEKVRREIVLGHSLGPLRHRLERREEFGIEEAGRVGAVVGTAVLRHHGVDLGEFADESADLVDVAVALLERDGRRHGGADPQVAFLELGQELEPEETHRHDGEQQQRDRAHRHQQPVGDRETQDRRVEPVHPAHHDGVGLLHAVRQQKGRQRRRDREGGDQSAGQRIGVGLGHRPENVPLHAAQGEQRDEGRDDDAGGEEDRPVDGGGGIEDLQHLAAQRVGRPFARQRLGVTLRRRLGEPAEDGLDHDHGRVDDQPEVDRADREEIGRFAPDHQDADREGEREGNGRAHDDGAAQIADEHPLQEEDQRDAEHHVVQHGAGGDVDQLLAVVDALDLHAGRQDAGRIDALDLLVHALDRGHALLAAAHQHDALHDVVGLVLARDAEPRLVAHHDAGDILDQHRIAAALGEHGVAQILDRTDEADAAHDRRLRSDIHGVAADVDVAVAQRLQQLRQRDPVGDQLVEIDLQFVGLGLAAPAGDVDDARNGAKPALQHPVLQGLEIEHAVAGGADQPVAIDLADRGKR